MKKITLLTIILFFVTLAASCVGNLDIPIRNGQAAQKPKPRISKVAETQLSIRKSIFSVTLKDEGTLFSVQSPPEIIKFGFNQDGTLQILERHEPNNKWPLHGITFIDSVNAFVVGSYGTVLKTVNGGKTWSQMPQVSKYDLDQAAFVNPSIGYVAGHEAIINQETQELESKIEIWKTEDGGNSWTKSYYSDNDSAVFHIATLSPEIALALISGKRLIRTTDGGKTWDTVFDAQRLGSFTFNPDGTGWLVGSDGNFLKSIDKGENWLTVNNLPNEFLNYRWSSIAIGKTGNGLAVSEEGIIAFTFDNGATWEKFPTTFEEPLRKTQVHDEVGIISGANNIYRVDFSASTNAVLNVSFEIKIAFFIE